MVRLKTLIRAIFGLVVVLALSGCIESNEPLLTPSDASYPLPAGSLLAWINSDGSILSTKQNPASVVSIDYATMLFKKLSTADNHTYALQVTTEDSASKKYYYYVARIDGDRATTIDEFGGLNVCGHNGYTMFGIQGLASRSDLIRWANCLSSVWASDLVTLKIASTADQKTRMIGQVDAALADNGLEPPADGGADEIKITSPALTRGTMQVALTSLALEGTVSWTSPATGLLINDKIVQVDEQGRFQTDLTLETGPNTIRIIAFTKSGMILQKAFNLTLRPDDETIISGGRRYALVIGNQDYPAASGFPSLDTPINDADSIARELSARYGFSTEVDEAGKAPQSLILHDATKTEIEQALFNLGKVVGPDDSVVIYYAGHGDKDPEADRSYWIPTDAQDGATYTYVSDSDVRDDMARMHARRVLLVVDSCFSSGFTRGASDPLPASPPASDPGYQEYLKRMAVLQSRKVIVSGNDSPVADGGGDGHSVFAAALLDGLAHMDQDAFTSADLFTDYVQKAVIGEADQTPEFLPLQNDKGGDFVFVRSAGQ